MVVAGSSRARYRFPCVSAETASVLTQQKECRIRADRRARADAALQELHLLMALKYSPAEPGSAQGKRSAAPEDVVSRGQSTCKIKKNNTKPQARPRNGYSSHTHAPSSSRMEKAESAGDKAAMRDRCTSAGVAPGPGPPCAASATVQRGSSPQFPLQQTPLVRESQRAAHAAHPCLSFGISLTRAPVAGPVFAASSAHLDNEAARSRATRARSSQPRWHSEATLKSSAGSKTALIQADEEHETLQSGSSCQHLLTHQPSSSAPPKPAAAVRPEPGPLAQPPAPAGQQGPQLGNTGKRVAMPGALFP